MSAIELTKEKKAEIEKQADQATRSQTEEKLSEVKPSRYQRRGI